MATGRVPTTANSPLTAKGDLFGYSTTQARVAVGNNGETLLADSSTSTGLRWNPNVYGGKNFLINGGFDFWQRSTSSASSDGYFTADRWLQITSGTTTHSQDTDVPTGIGTRYSIKWVTGAATSYGQWYQPMERALVEALRGQTLTASVYVKTSSYGSGNLVWQADYKTTSDAFAGGGWSNITYTSITPPTAWTRYSITFTVPSNAVGMRIALLPDAVQGSGVTVKMTGTQLEVGSVATAFSRAGGTLAGELAACQRYYQRLTADTAFGAYALNSAGSSTTNIQSDLILPVPMRTIVSSIDYSSLSWITAYGLATTGITAATLNTTCTTSKAVVLDLTTTGVTSGTRYRIVSQNNANGYLGFNAEL